MLKDGSESLFILKADLKWSDDFDVPCGCFAMLFPSLIPSTMTIYNRNYEEMKFFSLKRNICSLHKTMLQGRKKTIMASLNPVNIWRPPYTGFGISYFCWLKSQVFVFKLIFNFEKLGLLSFPCIGPCIVCIFYLSLTPFSWLLSLFFFFTQLDIYWRPLPN